MKRRRNISNKSDGNGSCVSSRAEKTNSSYLALCCVYAICMLCLLLFALGRMSKERSLSTDPVTDTVRETVTEYVYIEQPIYDEVDLVLKDCSERYLVRSYLDRIGIFSSDGVLVKVIEVYVKTLPEADIRLLEEGFEVFGVSELNSVIEDYYS